MARVSIWNISGHHYVSGELVGALLAKYDALNVKLALSDVYYPGFPIPFSVG